MLSSKRKLNFESENFDNLSYKKNYKKFKNNNNVNYYSNKPFNRFKENEEYFNFSLNEKTNNINNSSNFSNDHFFNKPKDICRKLNFLDEENSNINIKSDVLIKNNENIFNNYNLTSNNNNYIISTYQNTTEEKNKNDIIEDNFSVSSFKNNSFSNENEEEEKNDFLFIRKQSSTSLCLNYNKFDEEYVVIKTLNKGEQGTVYLCMKFQDKLPYVVKTTNFFSSKNDYKNMTNFVKIMNNLTNLPISEYILRYIDFWIENNKDLDDDEIFFENKNNKNIKNLYIVNKYLPNGNLTDYINSLKLSNFNFSENFYWDVIFEIMCGVLFIHKMGYIHFDIKPTNFLVDENGKILLNDFCLSRPENDLDSFEEIEGDSIYLSLEVFKKKNISQKSDLFSLGLSIFEILTDFKLPKNGDLWQEIRYNKIPENLLNLIKFNNIKFQNLILILTNINPFNRIDIENIFNDNINFPELYYRYVLLNNGNYVRNFNPSLWKEFKNENIYDFTNFNSHNAFTKRSDSMKIK